MTIMIPAWVDGTLQPVEKLEAHERGLKHKAVSVFVTRGDQVLIQRRALSKYHTPGLWANTCCTHPDWDETAAACAMRRLQDELGITGVVPHHMGQVEYRAGVGGGMIEHEVVEIFRAEAGPGMTLAPNPEEVMDIRWVPRRDLEAEVRETPDRFTPWLRIYLERHAGLVFGADKGAAD
ncbi:MULTISPECIES: isopentenyl-diphosphate Delta-isomerase [Mameliella]|uniref:isopentenyl-diphosphate Delta-isomerase n=1 Tax=Mameliella TaxID=1434019 RepID=UPI00087EB4A1|nr:MULTISPECIES: isopentenyl-diphosphate Delta-isomerase [Mameliella]MCR9273005.1 isopentenyl-diphosphate Delta-isomerase [Paracoccaceae bacterium]MBY6120729.1 isopentenyl-diphosphate Delta-isomerase [Mameliella alba]OWV43028.1 isopentenyl-diphosphate delta-isomerase [Mameliella alba]OWV47073.1 isopentenyl-diphosphate delta-isomerase [Mameliella alba]OWV56044.1 isopentenyl-diphosphate delta-isomerase [Mameliella alba]